MAFEIDPIEDLSGAIDWLVDAVGPVAPRPFNRVADAAGAARAVDDLEQRIEPLVLPAEIRWFWETWDPEGFVVLPAPSLHDTVASLESWTLLAWSEGDAPRALLPIGYASHAYLLVDLTDADGAPASLWSHDCGDIVCEAPSLAALVRATAERIEAEVLDPRRRAAAEEAPYAFFGELVGDSGLHVIMDRHFAASGVERRSLSEYEPEGWPARWHDAQRSMTGGSRARGRTHTVAELLAVLSRDDPHVRARLHGTLGFVSGLERGPDELVRLEDATGTIHLALPHGRLAPGWERDVPIEVEVLGRGPVPSTPQGRRPDPDQVRRAEEQHGSWTAYLTSVEGRTDPVVRADLDQHLRDLAAFKGRVPRIERTDLIDP